MNSYLEKSKRLKPKENKCYLVGAGKLSDCMHTWHFFPSHYLFDNDYTAIQRGRHFT